MSLNDTDFTKYNWVEAEDMVNHYFYPYKSAEYNWMRDLWNILMFNSIVKESNIAKRRLPIEDEAGIMTWLLAFYDLYCDYEVIIGLRNYYESGPGIVTDYQKDIISKIRNRDMIMAIVNNHLKGNFYLTLESYNHPTYFFRKQRDIEDALNRLDFVTTHFGSKNDPLTGVYVSHAVLSQVLRKRHLIVSVIFDYFKGSIEEIILFITGHHWREHYTSYYEQETELYKMRERIESYHNFNDYRPAFFIDEEKVNQLNFFKKTKKEFLEEFQEKLQELRNKYPVSIEYPNELKNKRISEYRPSLQEWIERGMPHLLDI